MLNTTGQLYVPRMVAKVFFCLISSITEENEDLLYENRFSGIDISEVRSRFLFHLRRLPCIYVRSII
jgi:hypothetical protein